MFWTVSSMLTIQYVTSLVSFTFLWKNANPLFLDESANGWKKMLMAKLGPVAPGVPGLRSGTQHAACLIHYDSVDWRPARWKHVLGVEVCYPFGRVFIIFSSGLIILLVWRRDLIEEEILIDFQLSLGWICEWDKAIDSSAWLSIKCFTKKSGTVSWFLHLFGFVCLLHMTSSLLYNCPLYLY